MKILGEKSLSSKVENALKILFSIISLLDIIVLGVCSITLFSEYSSSSMIENYLSKIILMTIISIVFLTTGIVALFIIHKFIKIFRNLRDNKLFEEDNIKYLNQVSNLSVIIGILYFIVLLGVSIVLGKYVSFGLLSNVLIKVLISVFSIAFLIFGIGIKVVNEIYKKAIEYKEENDLTV